MTTGNNNSNNKKEDITSKKLDQFTIYCYIGGLIVLIIGIISHKLMSSDSGEIQKVIIYVGLGIILSTIGSTGFIKYRNIYITGGAAITFVLLTILIVVSDKSDKIKDKDRLIITHGTLNGPFENAEIEIIGDDNQPLYGAKVQKGKCYRFLVIGKINRDIFEIIITFRKNPLSDKEGANDSEVWFGRINSDKINTCVNKKEKIEWQLFIEKDKYIIKDHKDGHIAEIGHPKVGHSMKQIRENSWLNVKKAIAQEYIRNIKDVIVDLSSGSSEVRRAARRELAQNANYIPVMMEEFRKHQDIYQVRLGIIESMNEMLIIDKRLAFKISEKLTTNALSLLVKCLNDRDLTIRVAASHLLYDLADTRVVPFVLQYAREVDSPEYLYLYLVAIKGAFLKLTDSEKRLTKEQLKAIIEANPPLNMETTMNLFNNLDKTIYLLFYSK